jgi:hypothetical protein
MVGLPATYEEYIARHIARHVDYVPVPDMNMLWFFPLAAIIVLAAYILGDLEKEGIIK